MGAIKCGFWTFRFIISPEEFSTWVDLCQNEGFFFENKSADIEVQFKNFYNARMDMAMMHEVCPLVNSSITKKNFKSAFHLTSGQSWRFFYKSGKNSLDSMFLQLSTPKQHSVASDDGFHFTYEDILQKEPDVKTYFDRFTQPLKCITKPLYQFGKPMYSVRISKKAYADLLKSTFYKEMSEGLTSSWK